MIPLSLQIVLALILDTVCGDPRWFPHPVKGIGWLALKLEKPLRCRFTPRTAGVVALLLIIIISSGLAWLIVFIASWFHPLLGDLAAIFLLYTCFALRDLGYHAMDVYPPLVAGDLALARERVAMLVGRDTDQLDEGEITRAAVESIAENTVDGITAPLLFAFIGGAPGALFYKAVNTLDSMFGYKNDQYLHFGWAAARFDDLVNFIPARITGLLTPLAAWLVGFNGKNSWRIFCRDRNNHPSPNGGQTEAAFAGALDVKLGGLNSYGGQKSYRPEMGDSEKTLSATHIKKAIRLMVAVSLLVVGCGILLRL